MSKFRHTFDPVIIRSKGESIVLTARRSDNKFIEVVVNGKYRGIGEGALETTVEIVKTDFSDPDDIEAAIKALESAISFAPGYNWMAPALGDIARNTGSLILNRNRQLDQILDEAVNGSGNNFRNENESASTIRSPIIFDLDGTGISTVGLAARVHFDHEGDGFAERTGWVGRGDGLLVWDRNGDGIIDSGQELFGSETLLINGMRAVNGFEALSELDANGDGVIDASDPIFAELRVWVDANIYGHTDEGELLTLEEAGIQAINVAYDNSSYIDANGNEHRQVGSFVTTEGETRTATDVWFQTDALFSIPTEWVDVSEDMSALPDARGFGTVRDLHQAMAMDESGMLQSLVSAFVAADSQQDRKMLLNKLTHYRVKVRKIEPYYHSPYPVYCGQISEQFRRWSSLNDGAWRSVA